MINNEREIKFLKERNYQKIEENMKIIQSYNNSIQKMRKENTRLKESIAFLNSL
jgi:hypothetical protein